MRHTNVEANTDGSTEPTRRIQTLRWPGFQRRFRSLDGNGTDKPMTDKGWLLVSGLQDALDYDRGSDGAVFAQEQDDQNEQQAASDPGHQHIDGDVPLKGAHSAGIP